MAKIPLKLHQVENTEAQVDQKIEQDLDQVRKSTYKECIDERDSRIIQDVPSLGRTLQCIVAPPWPETRKTTSPVKTAAFVFCIVLFITGTRLCP